MNNQISDLPFTIDLNDTFLRSELLIETLLLFLRDQPRRFLAPLGWLTRGKANRDDSADPSLEAFVPPAG